MRKIFNKLIKKEKKENSSLDKEILKSDAFQALQNMNYIMNFFDNIQKINPELFDPLEGMEPYIEARFASSNFMNILLEKISKEIIVNETETKMQEESK